MAVHQCARFFDNLYLVNERALRCTTKYLAILPTYTDLLDGNSEKGKGIECYVDASVAGSWAQSDADNAESFMSRTGYVISNAVCFVLWCSKQHTEIDLIITSAYYIALGQEMTNIIIFMVLMKEISFIFDIDFPNPEVFC